MSPDCNETYNKNHIVEGEMMGEHLFSKFLDEECEDLQTVILNYGVHGLMLEFELWLEREGYLKARKNV